MTGSKRRGYHFGLVTGSWLLFTFFSFGLSPAWPCGPRRCCWCVTLTQRAGRSTWAVALGAAGGGGSYWLLHRGLPSPALDVAGHAVYPYQLLSPAWGFGMSTTGWQDTLPLQLGFAAFGLAALALALRPKHAAPTLFTAYCLLFTILFATTLARPLWRSAPVAATLTYPWQLYALAGPLLIWLAAEALDAAPTLAARPALAALIAVVVLASYPYLAPRFTQAVPDPGQPHIFQPARVTLVQATAAQAPAAEIEAGRPLTVTLSWQPLQPPDFDYNVFIHALDAAGNRVAQWDGQPQRGTAPAPMTQWAAGEVVTGAYRLDLPASTDPQQLWIGLYHWQTGQRLTLTGGDDKVAVEVQP